MLQEEFQVSRAEVGEIASYSTFAYVVGKFVFGRFGPSVLTACVVSIGTYWFCQ